jgi:CTP:molybdopterin cytidylyltransferase MocA
MLDALILLAGFSRRMGQLKQHTSLGGHTFLEIISSKLNACRSQFRHLLFVGQENDSTAEALVASNGGIWLTNPHPELGPLSSIRIALRHYSDDTAKLLWPVDHPMIANETVSRLIELWQSEQEKISVPSDGKRRGHPTIFPGWCCREFFDIGLEEGAKKILQMYPERINYLLTDDIWITRNLNTPQLLAEAEAWLQVNQAL